MSDLLTTPLHAWPCHPAAQALGVAAEVEGVRPLSSYGGVHFRSRRPFVAGDEDAAEAHFQVLAGIDRADADDADAVATLSAVLRTLPDISDVTPSLSNLDASGLARLHMAVDGLATISERLHRLGLNGHFDLDRRRESIDISRSLLRTVQKGAGGYRIHDAASPLLASLRKNLAESAAALASLRADEVTSARSAAGLGPGLEQVAVDRNSAREQAIIASGRFEPVRRDAAVALYRVVASESLRELEQRHAQALAQERDEQRRLVREVGQSLKRHAAALADGLAEVGRLDWTLALHRRARDYTPRCLPGIASAAPWELSRACYLPLLHRMGGASARAETAGYALLSLRFGGGPTTLRGANMSGKTVAVKTVGAAAALMAAGLPTPAEQFRAPLLAALHWAEPGAGDLDRGLSAFGRECAFITEVMSDVRRLGPAPVLALMDEPLRTTDAAEGRALYRALLEWAAAHPSLALISSTHFDGLDDAPASWFHTGGLRRAPLSPELLRVIPDQPGRVLELMDFTIYPGYGQVGSDALHVAALLGLDAAVVERARSLLTERRPADISGS